MKLTLYLLGAIAIAFVLAYVGYLAGVKPESLKP